MVENQETLQSNTQVATMLAEEPAQSPVERELRTQSRKLRIQKKVAAGRADAAARKAKQERLLEQLRAAKESFHPPCGRGQYSSKGSGVEGPGTYR